MADYWYENTKLYGNETYSPPKLCENAYCLYGEESGKIGRSTDIEKDYSARGYKHFKCKNCGLEWKEEREEY